MLIFMGAFVLFIPDLNDCNEYRLDVNDSETNHFFLFILDLNYPDCDHCDLNDCDLNDCDVNDTDADDCDVNDCDLKDRTAT